jgi:hypothetical protein
VGGGVDLVSVRVQGLGAALEFVLGAYYFGEMTVDLEDQSHMVSHDAPAVTDSEDNPL